MTPAGTSNELDVQNGWEENTTHYTIKYYTILYYTILYYTILYSRSHEYSNIKSTYSNALYVVSFQSRIFLQLIYLSLPRAGSESIEATIRSRRVLFERFVARVEDMRLPKCVTFGELVGGTACVRRKEKEWMRCLLDDLRAFGIKADQWTPAAHDEGGMAQDSGPRGGMFHTKWIVAEKGRAGLRHAVECPNVTGKIKEIISQSKRVRAGWLTIVD